MIYADISRYPVHFVDLPHGFAKRVEFATSPDERYFPESIERPAPDSDETARYHRIGQSLVEWMSAKLRQAVAADIPERDLDLARARLDVITRVNSDIESGRRVSVGSLNGPINSAKRSKNPTPQEIAEACAEIRRGWSEKDHERRSAHSRIEAETQIVKVGEVQD